MKTNRLIALIASLTLVLSNSFAVGTLEKKNVPIVRKDGLVLGNGGGAHKTPIVHQNVLEIMYDEEEHFFELSSKQNIGLVVVSILDDSNCVVFTSSCYVTNNNPAHIELNGVNAGSYVIEIEVSNSIYIGHVDIY